MGATALVELRGIPLDPPKHRGVIDGDAAFPQQLFDITVAQGIAEIPPHGADDDLRSKVTPFEEWGLGHERSPVICG
jgi:hypothetical protein